MKNRMNWWMISVVALSFGACQKKEEVKAPAPAPAAPVMVTPAEVAPTAPPPAVTTAAPSIDERAAKLGFVKHLPQDTEVVMALHNGTKAADRIQSSKLWKLVQGQLGMGMAPAEGMPPVEGQEPNEEEIQLPQGKLDAADDAALAAIPDAAEPNDEEVQLPDGKLDAVDDAALAATAPDAGEPSGPGALFGTEFTIALGKSTGEQTANLLMFYRRMGYLQMRMLAKAFVAAVQEGDISALEQAVENQYGPGFFKDLLADPESGVALIERLKMPPLYLAFRTSESARPAAAQQLAGLVANLGMLGEEVVEPVEVEKAGQTFAGHKISGAKISASMGNNRAELEEMLEPAVVDKLLAAIAKKDLVAVSGTLGDYTILFIGSSTDELKFAASPGQSLVASNALTFCDAYATKELAAVIYGQKGATDQMIAAAGGISDMVSGLRDGLAGAAGLGDTRDLEALLRLVADRETALRKLAGNEALGVAAFFEDGLKIESFGGTDNGAIDWKATNKLAALGDSEDVVMFANMATEAAYDAQARAYLEALMETGYALAMKVAELKAEDEKLAQFKEMAKLLDTKFRTDLVALWATFSGDFYGSLGNERACIVDLNGSVPAIPGIPQKVVDQGKFPRISMVAPVTDRKKLAASWTQMNASATSILAKVSEMAGEEIPMQKPISSEKNGFTTWFFSMPFFNDDFLPSVTVGDQWFAASTSKNQALDLVAKAAKGGTTGTGLCFTLNFKALQKFSRATCKLLDDQSEPILGAVGMQLKDAGQLVDAMDDMDKLTAHVRRDAGVLRSSIHFKTR